MIAYFDASAFSMLILQDTAFEIVERWIEQTDLLPAISDFGWGEFTSAVGIRVRSQRITASTGAQTLTIGHDLQQQWRKIAVTSDDIADATACVARFDLGLPARCDPYRHRPAARLHTRHHRPSPAARRPGARGDLHRPDPIQRGYPELTKLPLWLLTTALIACPTPALAQRTAAPPVAADRKVAALRDRALADDTAYAIVEGLTTEVGPRMTGTEAAPRARAWAVAKLKAMGFRNVRIETYELPVWARGAESAALVAPYPLPLHVVGLGNSGATPPGGLTLPITYFASYNDLALAPEGSLKGRIAFVSNTMQPTQDGSSYGSQGTARFVGPNVAAKKGAAAIVIRSIGTDHGRGPHAGTTDFEAGVAPIPAAALSVADAEQVERLVERGTPVTLHLVLDDHQVGTRPSGNVVAEVPGSDPGAGIVLIGGHLDSWDLGTGAIDDGAGVAITAAAAKIVMDAPGTLRRTIRLVWFGDEEGGGFGGRAYAGAHAGERHAIAAESDFGADVVWRFESSLTGAAKPIADRLAVALTPLGIGRGAEMPHGGTDVGPIIATGVAAIDLVQSGLRYFDWHHTPEDTLDRIDPVQLKQNVAAWTAMLATVADAPEEIGPVAPKK